MCSTATRLEAYTRTWQWFWQWCVVMHLGLFVKLLSSQRSIQLNVIDLTPFVWINHQQGGHDLPRIVLTLVFCSLVLQQS
jgi:hypothetical protein